MGQRSLLASTLAVGIFILLPTQAIAGDLYLFFKQLHDHCEDVEAAHEQAMLDRAAARRAAHAQREACHERRQTEMRSNIDQSIETDLGVKLNQRIRLGQPQVDMAKLKAKIEEIEKENKELEKLHAEMEKQSRQQQSRKYEDYLRANIAARSPEAGCACRPPCLPNLPAQVPPLQRAMLPTEIPITIPATIELTFENAEIEESRVRNLPAKIPCERPKLRNCPPPQLRPPSAPPPCPTGQCPPKRQASRPHSSSLIDLFSR